MAFVDVQKKETAQKVVYRINLKWWFMITFISVPVIWFFLIMPLFVVSMFSGFNIAPLYIWGFLGAFILIMFLLAAPKLFPLWIDTFGAIARGKKFEIKRIKFPYASEYHIWK